MSRLCILTGGFSFAGGVGAIMRGDRLMRVIYAYPITAALLVIAGAALITWGQLRWFDSVNYASPGALPVLIGMVLVLVSVRARLLMPDQPSLFAPVRHAGWYALWQFPVAGIGFTLAALAAHRALPDDVLVWNILLMWGAGILLALVGIVPHKQIGAWWHRTTASLQRERMTWGLLLLTLVAFVIRVAWLNTSPAIFAGDEAQFGQEAIGLRDHLGGHYNPFQLGLWHHPRTYHTLIWLTIELVGQNAAAVRLPAAVFGTLTVPAIYLLGRRLFSPAVGWGAALFMVTFPIHVQFSRTGMDMTGDPFFVTLSFAFLVRALRTDDRFEAALAGTALGLSQYFYFAGRIAIFLLGAYGVLLLVTDWRAVLRRKAVFATLGVMLVITAGPNVYAMINDTTRPFNPRLAHVSIWETGELDRARNDGRLAEYVGQQFQRGFLAYVLYQDESDIYGRYNPVMGWYAGVPLMVGVAVVIRRWRDPRSVMLLLWCAGTALAGGALLIDPPHYPRYVSATPALALIVAIGLLWAGQVLHLAIAQLFQPHVPAWLRGPGRDRYALVGVLTCALVAANLYSYVFGYLPKTDTLLYGYRTQVLNQVVHVLDGFEGRYTVVRFSSQLLDMNGSDLIRYLSPENSGVEYRHDLAAWREHLGAGPHAFVVAPDRFGEVVPVLQALFPDGELQTLRDPENDAVLIHAYFADIQGREDDG